MPPIPWQGYMMSGFPPWLFSPTSRQLLVPSFLICREKKNNNNTNRESGWSHAQCWGHRAPKYRRANTVPVPVPGPGPSSFPGHQERPRQRLLPAARSESRPAKVSGNRSGFKPGWEPAPSPRRTRNHAQLPLSRSHEPEELHTHTQTTGCQLGVGDFWQLPPRRQGQCLMSCPSPSASSLGTDYLFFWGPPVNAQS